MKNEYLSIANETIQQLRNFRDSISTLPFNLARKSYYSNLLGQYELRIQSENLELEMIKLQIIAKLHQDIFNKGNFSEYSEQIANEAERKVMQIYEVLSERLPQSQENIHKKIIVSVMNYKFHLQKSSHPRLSLQELLVTVQEMNLWQSFTQQHRNYLKFFYLCLMWQYLSSKDLQTFMEIVNLYANYLTKTIQSMEKEKTNSMSQQLKQILIDLLHSYNTFKLFKKQFNLQSTLADQSQIYSVLYEVDYSLSEQIIYQYKKLNKQSQDDVVRIIKGKLQQNIKKFDEKCIDRELNLLSDQPTNKSSKQHIILPIYHRNRKSSHDLLSQTIKKKDIQNLKPVNNVFVPRRINVNLQLERRLQIKKQSKPSVQKIPSSTHNIFRRSNKKIANKLTPSKNRNNERQPTIVKDMQQKNDNVSRKKLERLSYQSCKKSSTNKYEQLQMMICERNRGLSLKINRQSEENHIHKVQVQKLANNRKKRVPNRKGSVLFTSNGEQKKLTFLQLDYNSGQIYPPLIRSALNQYIRSFTTFFKYRAIKYTLPLYTYFHSIDKSNTFYLKGEMIRFVSIQTRDLTLRVVYSKNQKQLKTAQFKLYEQKEQEIRSLFMSKGSERKLGGFYKLGGNLTYFSFRLKNDHLFSAPIKFKVSEIRYQQQIYTYNVYLNNKVNKNHYKKILTEQERFIKKIDEDLNIQFQYGKPVHLQTVEKKEVKSQLSLRDVLNINYKRDMHKWRTLFSLKLSLKNNKTHSIFAVSHLHHLQSDKKYLFFNYTNTAKLKSLFQIASYSQGLNLESYIQNVSSFQEIKTKIITSNHMLQQNWNDLILNRGLFDFNSKKYVVAKQPKGYEVFISQTLIQKNLDLIRGESGKTKWFVLLHLLDFEGLVAIQSVKSTNKILKPPRQRSVCNVNSFVSIKSKKYMQVSKQHFDTTPVSPVKLLKKEGKTVTIGKESFKCLNYEYSWCMFLRQKVYYCFKMQSRILSMRIRGSKLIYFRSCSTNEKLQNKQIIFKEFRRFLTLQVTSKWLVFGFRGIVGLAQILNNCVVIKIKEIQGSYSVQISASELYGISSIKLSPLIFNNKYMLQRVVRIAKYKLNQKMILRS